MICKFMFEKLVTRLKILLKGTIPVLHYPKKAGWDHTHGDEVSYLQAYKK